MPASVGVISRVAFPIRGAWIAPRSTAGLDSSSAVEVLAEMRASGVTHVAVGHDVSMPKFVEPRLEWGEGDGRLRVALRAIRKAGMQAFLLPRIESPDFFEPPYPFRADIAFADPTDWDAFHDNVEQMALHYAKLAQEEQVAIFGVGLELKQSVKEFEQRWREIVRAVRKVYSGSVTYSANWYDEWLDVPFWDELDYVGIGAYFELHAEDGLGPDADPVADVAARWRPVATELRALSERVDRPVLFTEIGYTGYVDCVERPWEWAGKQDKGVAIDHERQAQAYAGLFQALGSERALAGMFAWTFYSGPHDIADWEYALQSRPAGTVLRQAYGGATSR